MAIATRVDAEEFARLQGPESKFCELVRGEIIQMAPPGFGHGGTAVRIAFPLEQVVREHQLGWVVVESGFKLFRDPDTVRAPDVAFVSVARLPPLEERDGFFPGAPDLAVEVVSPGDTASEVFEKVQEYLTAGTRLVWVADARLQRVTVYRANGTVQFHGPDDALSGEDVLPGFTLAIRDIFR